MKPEEGHHDMRSHTHTNINTVCVFVTRHLAPFEKECREARLMTPWGQISLLPAQLAALLPPVNILLCQVCQSCCSPHCCHLLSDFLAEQTEKREREGERHRTLSKHSGRSTENQSLFMYLGHFSRREAKTETVN